MSSRGTALELLWTQWGVFKVQRSVPVLHMYEKRFLGSGSVFADSSKMALDFIAEEISGWDFRRWLSCEPVINESYLIIIISMDSEQAIDS